MHLPHLPSGANQVKRRPLLLATVLTVTAIACIVPFSWEIWLRVAYAPACPILQDGAPLFPDEPQQIFVHYKRIEWGPGALLYVPPQACRHCKKTEHENCSVAWKVFDRYQASRLMPLRKSKWDVAKKWGKPISEVTYCTCPTCHPERER